jgi:hypothetical protein
VKCVCWKILLEEMVGNIEFVMGVYVDVILKDKWWNGGKELCRGMDGSGFFIRG